MKTKRSPSRGHNRIGQMIKRTKEEHGRNIRSFGKTIWMERADCYITNHIKVQTSEE